MQDNSVPDPKSFVKIRIRTHESRTVSLTLITELFPTLFYWLLLT
jgi:hypothetical protein